MSVITDQHKENHTILYIEDDEANRTLVQFIIERRADISLLEAESGSEGIEMACRHLPDIILLDLSLPDITGFDVLKKLKDAPSVAQTPVIALTGDSLPEDRAKAMKAGFYGYLTKPLSVQDFYTLLDKTLADLSAG